MRAQHLFMSEVYLLYIPHTCGWHQWHKPSSVEVEDYWNLLNMCNFCRLWCTFYLVSFLYATYRLPLVPYYINPWNLARSCVNFYVLNKFLLFREIVLFEGIIIFGPPCEPYLLVLRCLIWRVSAVERRSSISLPTLSTRISAIHTTSSRTRILTFCTSSEPRSRWTTHAHAGVCTTIFIIFILWNSMMIDYCMGIYCNQ